jgi:multidrug resistance efflux pump
MQRYWGLDWHKGWRFALIALLVLLSITSCSFGRGQATPEAVNLPTYEPGVSTTLTTSQPVTASVTVPSVGNTETITGETQAPSAAEATQPTDSEPATAEGVAQADLAVTAAPTATVAAAAEVAAEPASEPAPLLATYPAEIAADEEVVVVAEVSGQVIELGVEVGDVVKAGDVLARIDAAVLEAQRAQALAGLQAAKAQLDQLRKPVDDEDLEAARAAVAAASAAYRRAVNGPTEEERRQAQAQLQQAQAAVSVAQAAYNLVRYVPEVGMLPQGMQLQAATLGLEAAQAQYDTIIKGATQAQIAGAYAQLANAQAQLQRLEEGAESAQIRAVQAQVRTAENALYLAQLQVDKATVEAPMDGVVLRLQTEAGALAAPGAPLLTLLSPTVQVMIDVEETRLSQLRIGQPALIRVVAYPDRTFEGTVALIAPELDPATRTVEVTIRPDDPEGVLAPGMSSTVELLQ